jgi:hypothetical protein
MPRTKKPQIRVTKELKEKVRKKIKRNTSEPEFVFGTFMDGTEIMKVVSWYDENFDTHQSKKWALEWIKSEPELKGHKKDFQSMPHTWFNNKGFFCRILMRGVKTDTKWLIDAFKRFLPLLKDKVKETHKETQKTPPNALKLKLGAFDDFCIALDACEDDIFKNGEVDLKSKSVLEFACKRLGKSRDGLGEIKRRREMLVKDLDDGFYKGLEKKCRCLLKFYDYVCYNWLGEKK